MAMSAPRIRLTRRVEPSRQWTRYAPLLALAIAGLISGVLLMAAGHSPIHTFVEMARAAFLSKTALSATLSSATPLVFTGLAAAVAFRARVWNIGGEGQLYVGAVCATAAGLALGGSGISTALPAMVIAGAVGGAVWAAIPGVLRCWLKTNEIITSLMLNYVAGLAMAYLIFDSFSYWRDTSPAAALFPQGRTLADSASWPSLSIGGISVPFGFLAGSVLAAALLVAMRTTRFWFQVEVISSSAEAGRYAGLRMNRVVLAVFAISGALAGLGGASQIGDFSHVLEPSALQVAAFGYSGIVVAALARYNPPGVVLAAIALGALTNAGFKLQGPDFPAGIVGTMQGILLFCVLSSEFLARRKIEIVWRTQRAVPRSAGIVELPSQDGAPDLSEQRTS